MADRRWRSAPERAGRPGAPTRRNWSPRPGIVAFGCIATAVTVGPLVWPTDPGAIDLSARNAQIGPAHPLGTDHLGRDLLARLLHGGRVTLAAAVASTVVSISLGVGIGLLAGTSRRLDGPLMRLTDLALSLPTLPMLLLAVTVFREPLSLRLGPSIGPFALVVLAIGLTSWMQPARIVRSVTLPLAERPFVLAAIALGASRGGVVARHIVPNAWPSIAVSIGLVFAGSVLLESALSFLGVGFAPDLPTWGRLLNEAIERIPAHPLTALWPGLAIVTTVLVSNAAADVPPWPRRGEIVRPNA